MVPGTFVCLPGTFVCLLLVSGCDWWRRARLTGVALLLKDYL
jgi:hypothetical protein